MTTTVLETKIEGGLCRCCLTEGTYRNLSALYTWSGEREVYSEMLQESLDIHIKPVEGQFSELTWSICEACVLRLRDASSFKRQVLACELRFRELYQEHIVKGLLPLATVKIEVPEEQVEPKEEGDLHIAGDDFHDKYSDSDAEEKKNFNIEVQLEPLPLKKSRSAKAKTKSKGTEKKQSKAKKKKTKENAPESSEPTEDGPEPAKKGNPVRMKSEDFIRGVKVDDNEWYACVLCGLSLATKLKALEHIRTKHHVSMRIPRSKKTSQGLLCNHCEQTFRTYYRLAKHQFQQHDIPGYVCGVCDVSFCVRNKLLIHQRRVHMAEKNTSCDVCGLEFFSKAGLQSHMVTHIVEIKYECTFCKKKFPRKRAMLLHEKIHTGDKKKVCAVCQQAFVQKASLNYHMTKHHPDLA